MDDDLPDDDARLKALGESLKARVEPEAEVSGATNMALGMKYASEFAGAVIVTAFFGYLLDRFVGTTPWGMIGGVLLGTVAGVYSIVKSAQKGMT